MAAFSSVLKRTDDPETRVKAVFNLGNAAFKKGGFRFGQGLLPTGHRVGSLSTENARFNLELTLRELEKQKKQEEEKKKGQQQQKDQKKKDASEKERKGRGEKGICRINLPRISQQKDKAQDQNDQEKGDRKRTKGCRRPETAAEKRAPETRARPLWPECRNRKPRHCWTTSRRIGRDFLKFQVPEAEGQGNPSGKDW